MSRWNIEGTIVDTDRAVYKHRLDSVRAGYGTISDVICRSSRGRWYVVHDYSWSEDGRVLDFAEWLSPEEAARRLLLELPELPDYPELRQAADKISE